jgi:hypothetical protein
VFLNGDIAEKVANIKQQEESELHVWGTGNSDDFGLWEEIVWRWQIGQGNGK